MVPREKKGSLQNPIRRQVKIDLISSILKHYFWFKMEQVNNKKKRS